MAKILIVDDDEEQRVMLESALLEAGHELLFASDGEKAFRFYTKGRPELVITDLLMPNVDGLQLIRRLVDENPSIKVIAISGAVPEKLGEAQAFGAFATLEKPVQRDDLLELVEQGLSAGSDWGEVWL